MKPTVYPASKPRHAPMWRNLRDRGHLNIIGTWINYDEKDDNTIPCWTGLWLACAREAAAADVTVVYVERDDVLRGAYVEMGVALASGKLVIVVNPDDVTVTDAVHHPMVTMVKSMGAALDKIDTIWKAAA
jgi:hypothetical protein